MVLTHYYAFAPSKVLLEGDVVAAVEMFLNDRYEACQRSKGEFTTRSGPRFGIQNPPQWTLLSKLETGPKFENTYLKFPEFFVSWNQQGMAWK